MSKHGLRGRATLHRLMSLLLDYNTRVVLLGSALLGATAGIVGTFLVLRRRALVGDVIGHATLPGIAIAFLVAEIFAPGTGKNTTTVMIGATATGLLGAAAVTVLSRIRKVGPDAAQAVVLGLFFGVGASLFRAVQQIPTGNAAGLNGYLYGKAASLVAADVELFAMAGAIIVAIVLLLHKELVLVCFDPEFASATGLPVRRLDLVLTLLATAVAALGLQSVGLVLVVATLTIPPATARFWTDRAGALLLLAAFIGGATAVVGVLVSAMAPHIAAGATIVLAGGMCFAVSLLVGPKGGILADRLSRTTRHST